MEAREREWGPDITRRVHRLIALLKDPAAADDSIFEAYEALPFPRISYLGPNRRNTLLHRLAVMPDHNDTTLLRYLSVMDDLKSANLSPTRTFWNAAIHLVGRPFGRVSDAEAENALYIWKDMEQQQEIIGDEITFNILLNIATKAGKFALADAIVKEVEARGLKKTTPFRLGTILRAGRRGDGEAVRRAYREFVDAGEIVTTTVLNTVLSALYMAGEFAGAEALFETMRVRYGGDSHREHVPEDWHSLRKHHFDMQAQAERCRHDPVAREEVQNRAPLKPDGHTYKIMIRYACEEHNAGDLDRVDELLRQMRSSKPAVHLTAAMFYCIFCGFSKHGGRLYSTLWSPHRLDFKWRNYLTEFERDPVEFAFTKKMALAILHAFFVSAGRGKMSQIWPEIRARWRVETSHKGTGRGLDDLAAVQRWVRKYRGFEK